jgi:hypothetical protein
MDVIGQDDKFVKMKNAALAISEQGVEKHASRAFGLEQGSTPPGYRGDEESALGELVHSG